MYIKRKKCQKKYYYNFSTNEVSKLIDKICEFILKRMKKEMPDITKEKEEVITYGLQLILGEIPKMLLLFGISFYLDLDGIWYLLI